MKITDKIDVSNNIREGAGQGGKDLLPRKSVKSVEAVTAEMLESLKLEEADFFTISDELKNVIRSLAQKTGSEGPDEPVDKEDIKAFIGALFKDRALKGELSGVDISRAQDLPEPLEADVVSISREMNSLLKSVIISGSGEPREICIPQGAAMSPFLTALLNELFPGWRIRLLKVCRKKRRPFPGNDIEGEEEVIDPPKGEAAAHGFNNSPLKGYHADRIRFRAEGHIRTADKKDLKFGLELNVAPRGEVREDVFTLDPLTIDYGGPSTELDDMKFTFGSENGDSAFSAGAGRLIIDLREMGKDVDGSVIWGLDDSGKGIWTEE